MAKWLQDDKGNESSLRKIMALWSIVVLAVWAIISLYKQELVDLPAMIGTVVMATLTAKVWQKYSENKAPPKDEPPQE